MRIKNAHVLIEMKKKKGGKNALERIKNTQECIENTSKTCMQKFIQKSEIVMWTSPEGDQILLLGLIEAIL